MVIQYRHKFKKLVALILSVLFVLNLISDKLFNLKVFATTWDGTKDTGWYNSADTTFNLDTPEKLAGLAELVNGGNKFTNKTINLIADMQLNDTSNIANWKTTGPTNEWTPIGNSNTFNGVFNGMGHTISGIYINSSNQYIGLFGKISGSNSNCFINNVHIEKSYINSTTSNHPWNTGCLVGCAENSFVTDCDIADSVTLEATGCGYLGSIIGNLSDTLDGRTSTVNNCTNRAKINVETNKNSNKSDIGGIVGYNTGDVGVGGTCYNYGSVTIKNEENKSVYVGGIVGENFRSSTETNIENCVNDASVTLEISDTNGYVGGVCGYNEGGNIFNCINKENGIVTGCEKFGGITSQNMYKKSGNISYPGVIKNCKNYSSVSGNNYGGGITGWNKGGGMNSRSSIIGCDNYGDIGVTKDGGYVGGIAGKSENNGIVGDLALGGKCCNYGTVQGDIAGGIVGSNTNTSVVSNCISTGKVESSAGSQKTVAGGGGWRKFSYNQCLR